MKRLTISIIISIFITLTLGVTSISAADVKIIIDREYKVNSEYVVEVTETRVVSNNTFNTVIVQSTNKEQFTITALYDDDDNNLLLQQMANTVTIKNQWGSNLAFSSNIEDDYVVISAPYPQAIDPGQSYTFVFKYNNSQLAQKAGNLSDIFIQAFSEDFVFVTDGIEYQYNTKLVVPKDFGEENFVSPEPINKYSEGNNDVYEFSQDQLKEGYVWVQRGTKQFFKFTITQNINATEETNTGSSNEYSMIIPREFDAMGIDQNLYYSDISPAPKYIETDSDGNLIGVFDFPSHLDSVITITGFAEVISLGNNVLNIGTLADYKNDIDAVYTESSEFWEVDEPQIQSKASELKGSEDEVYKILKNTYDFIVDSIDYSDIKRFGLNVRHGALATLNGNAAVCMEYSDLYIALLRAQGVPARAAFGYGYDSKQPADEQELHQWVQAYIPTTETWLNIDVTWGESGPALIGGDMNHFLTHVASVHPNDPATLSGRTYGSKVSFDSVQFRIETLESIPNKEFDTSEDLLSRYQKPDDEGVIEVLQNFAEKINAGVESLQSSGVDPTNSAQVVLFITCIVSCVVSLFLLSIVIRFARRGRRKTDY